MIKLVLILFVGFISLVPSVDAGETHKAPSERTAQFGNSVDERTLRITRNADQLEFGFTKVGESAKRTRGVLEPAQRLYLEAEESHEVLRQSDLVLRGQKSILASELNLLDQMQKTDLIELQNARDIMQDHLSTLSPQLSETSGTTPTLMHRVNTLLDTLFPKSP